MSIKISGGAPFFRLFHSFRLFRTLLSNYSYLYRAVDKQGQTVDFLLTKNRDQAAAVRFLKKAIGSHDVPEKIKLDGSRPAQTLVRASKYLNNLIVQDHRKVEQRCYPMLGFKTFGNAEVTLSGIELANKIEKGQFDTSEVTGPRAMILHVWEAVLAA